MKAVFLGLTLFFVVAIAVSAFILLPDVREVVQKRMRSCWTQWTQWQRQQRQIMQTGTHNGLIFVNQEMGVLRGWLRQHRRAMFALAALLLLMPMLAIGLRHYWTLDTEDFERITTQDERVLALLAGEDLKPPPSFAARSICYTGSGNVASNDPLCQQRVGVA